MQAADTADTVDKITRPANHGPRGSQRLQTVNKRHASGA
jgi:hypothetical protein